MKWCPFEQKIRGFRTSFRKREFFYFFVLSSAFDRNFSFTIIFIAHAIPPAFIKISFEIKIFKEYIKDLNRKYLLGMFSSLRCWKSTRARATSKSILNNTSIRWANSWNINFQVFSSLLNRDSYNTLCRNLKLSLWNERLAEVDRGGHEQDRLFANWIVCSRTQPIGLKIEHSLCFSIKSRPI